MSCGCTADVCGCELNPSNTVDVSGSGTSGDPWFASVIPDPVGGLTTGATGVAILLDAEPCNLLTLSANGLLALLNTQDSPTVTFSGCGTAANPLIATAVGGGGGGGDGIADALPGDIWMTGASVAGPGRVMCDGTTYDSVADPSFAPLYAAIGTKFGGTGPDDFKVPFFNGRSPEGAGTGAGEDASGEQGTTPTGGALTNRDVGDWRGSEDVVLTEAQLAAHTHTGPSHTHTTPAHTHPIDHDHVQTENEHVSAEFTVVDAAVLGDGADTGMPIDAGEELGRAPFQIEGSEHNHDIDPFTGDSGAGGAGNTGAAGTGATGATGDGDPHANLAPRLAVNFVIWK